MVLEVVDTPSPLMSMARLGQHQPLFLGAAGRIIMAYMEPGELEKVLKKNAPPDFDRAAVDRELARFRRQGYALTRGQRVPGLTAIAVPLFDMHDRVPHSLALTGPSVRMDARESELAEIMLAAGRDVSTRLGASPEHAIDLKVLTDDAAAEKSSGPKKKPAAKTPGKPRRSAVKLAA
jgi:DNA-binding IclR family transcriptional regulator